MLTLAHVADNPEILTFNLDRSEGLKLRPLTLEDRSSLSAFFQVLSPTSRRFFSLSDDTDREAGERCSAIARYDKLRLILVKSDKVIGLFEFSLSLVDDDITRFAQWGIRLNPQHTIRFGPCVADEYQGTGVARNVMPFIADVAREFGRSRIILWGGVHTENTRAVTFYERVGFSRAGEFINVSGRPCLDMYKDLDYAN